MHKIAWLVAVLLAVSACTGDRAEPAPVPAKPTRSAEPPLVEPLAIADEPQWTVRVARDTTVHGTLRADTLVLHEDTGSAVLSAYDAASGKRWWRLHADRTKLAGGDGARWFSPWPATEPQLVESPGGPVVITDYVARSGEEGDEYGVVALSGADGRVLWRVPTVSPTGPRLLSKLAAANDELALVSVYPFVENDADAVRTVALDVTTGKRLWQQQGVWPLQISGDTIVGQVSERQPKLAQDAKPVALDAATGKRRWDVTDRYQSTGLLAAAGDVAVLAVAAPARRTVALDLRTGDVFAELLAVACTSDRESVVTCDESGAGPTRLAILRSDGRKTLSDNELAGTPEYGWGDYVFLDNGQLIDHAANVLADGLPHDVLAVSERYAAFTENDEVAVHRIG